jgi:hypothetical protein
MGPRGTQINMAPNPQAPPQQSFTAPVPQPAAQPPQQAQAYPAMQPSPVYAVGPAQQAPAYPAPQAAPAYPAPQAAPAFTPPQAAPAYPTQQAAPAFTPPQAAPAYPTQQAAPAFTPPQAAPAQPAPQQQVFRPAPQQPAPAANPYTPYAAPAQAQQVPPQAAPQAAAARGPAPTGKLLDVELGTHSASNFYKGLGGNDVIEHGGIFVATYKVPKIGTSVSLRLLLPGDLEFQANAVVQWTRDGGGAGESAEPGFGARFTQITAEGRQLVYRYTRNREPIFYDDL